MEKADKTNDPRLQRWYRLTLFEQMSNIDGEIKRYMDARDNYKSGVDKEDYSDFYFNKVLELIDRTESDPKNIRRIQELEDEKEQLRLHKEGKVSDEYITEYWNTYTKALSA
ncbi:MAG: hypothetical protein K6E77_09475 [Lachnospiraceae bacterium]|nr:hypothetical protein [Lachnospiraceae bacterium]